MLQLRERSGLGTVSCENLRWFLIGPSAEALLHLLNTDLLCVKENPLEHTEYGG